MTLEKRIQKFIEFRRLVCKGMLEEDSSDFGSLYVQGQENLLNALEENLKEWKAYENAQKIRRKNRGVEK